MPDWLSLTLLAGDLLETSLLLEVRKKALLTDLFLVSWFSFVKIREFWVSESLDFLDFITSPGNLS